MKNQVADHQAKITEMEIMMPGNHKLLQKELKDMEEVRAGE